MGSIRSKSSGKIMKPEKPRKGARYPRVTLCDKGKRTRTRVHVLVLLAFAGPRPEGFHARHLNDDPEDNRIENLRWGTASENVEDTRRNGIMIVGQDSPRAKLTEEEVREILFMKGVLGQRKLAKKYGVAKSSIRAIHQRKHWKHVEV